MTLRRPGADIGKKPHQKIYDDFPAEEGPVVGGAAAQRKKGFLLDAEEVVEAGMRIVEDVVETEFHTGMFRAGVVTNPVPERQRILPSGQRYICE